MDEGLARQIVEANIRVHRQEAALYDWLHAEIFNWYEQGWLRRDLSFMGRYLPDGAQVLDLGCGTGNVALKLAARGYRVTAVDLSPEMLARLERRIRGPVEVVCAAADDYLAATAATYDLICFSSVLHHLPDYDASLALAAQRLNSGGFLYVTHEPAIRRAKPRAHRWLHWLSEAWYSWTLRARGVPMGTIDYSLSDYHVPAGIDADELVRRLEGYGLHRVRERRYLTERVGVAAALSNALFRSYADCFSLMMRMALPPRSAA